MHRWNETEYNGVDTYAECNKNNRVLTKSQWEQNHQKYTRNKKDYSKTKITSFTEKLAVMVGMKSREKEEVTTGTKKSKNFGAISAIKITEGTAGHQNERAIESKVPSVELGS